jgi:sporulation protein YlmC with PRC-barrel domain
MKSILMTTSAVLLVTGFAAGQAQAACPEDIDAFNRQYEEALQNTAAGEALSTSEQAQLFGLRTAAENLHQAGNAEMCAAVIQRAKLNLESAIAPQVIKPDELVGREVVNAQDENLGEVEDVLIDPISGRIAYVVVEHGGFLGIGDDLFAVPWGAMRFVPGNDQTVLLDVPEEELENAPRFSRDDETPLERREWVTSVHNYYGVEPYWQDEVGAMAMQYGATGAAQTGGMSGEAKTIVVPVTTPESGDQSQTEEGQPEQDQSQDEQGQSQPEPQEPQPGSDSQQGTDAAGQSAAEPQTATAALVESQPTAESGGAESQEFDALASRMDELEQQLQTLSEQMPGQEMTETMSRLEQQVQQLSQQVPGQEIQQQIAQLQEQIAAMGDSSGAAGNQQAGSAQGEPATVVVVPDAETQAGQQPGQEQPGDQQLDQQQPGEGSQQQGGGQQAGQQPSGDQPIGEQQAAQSGQSGSSGQQTGQQDQESAAPGRTVLATPSPATEGDSAGQQPCGDMVAQLEEDLERAEQLGVAVDGAQSELDEAQAMLNNNSEALCRAAVKRAQEELVAVGFEPTQSN